MSRSLKGGRYAVALTVIIIVIVTSTGSTVIVVVDLQFALTLLFTAVHC
jgi:hypothetical protein